MFSILVVEKKTKKRYHNQILIENILFLRETRLYSNFKAIFSTFSFSSRLLEKFIDNLDAKSNTKDQIKKSDPFKLIIALETNTIHNKKN